MSSCQVPRQPRDQTERQIASFVAAVAENKRRAMRNRARRIGPWLFAWHRTIGMTWRPRLDRHAGGWSVWWLWFEVARFAQ